MSRKPSVAAAVAAKAKAMVAQKEEAISFRDFLYSEDFAHSYMEENGVSPAIEGIALASEGLPVPVGLLSDEEVEAIFRCGRDTLKGIKPRVVAIEAGRQGGKTSQLLAPKAVHAAWTTPIPNLKPGQIARAVIISPTTDQSKACFNYCRGIIDSSPVLSKAVRYKKDQILLTRPDGTQVEIVVGAADRGGKAARSRTIIFAGLDEAAFFYPEGSAVANDRDIYDAVLGTLQFLDGAQIWIVSTPWIEGVGLLEELVEEYWGKPSFALVAARISSYTLRGIPDDGSLRTGWDDDTYNREILANPLPAGSESFFKPEDVKAAEARELPADASIVELGAGTDLGFLSDSSALVVASRRKGGAFSVDHLEELSPKIGEPLKPTVVCNRFAHTLGNHGISSVASDIHEKATALELFGNHKIRVVDAPTHKDEKERLFRAARTLFEEGRISLAYLPEAERVNLRNQLRLIVAKPRPGGGWEISAPRVSSKQKLANQGKSIKGHADSVSALVLALWRAGSCDPSLWTVKPNIWTGPKKGDPRRRPQGRDYGGWAGRNRDDYQRG